MLSYIARLAFTRHNLTISLLWRLRFMFKNKKLDTLFFTMVVMMLGFGIIIPIMPFYMEHFGAGGSQLGALMAVFSVMQFISSPYWGGMSDRYGRKKIMMIGVLGNALSLVVIGLAQNMEVIFV